MPRTRAKILVHLVFTTKNRQRLIDDNIRDELHGFIVQTLGELRSPAILLNSVADHLHIFYWHSKKRRIERVANELKKRSTIWISTRGSSYSGFCWQLGCVASLVRKTCLGTTVEYLLRENQRRRTFEQQYQDFLKRYGLAPERRDKKGQFRPFQTGGS